MVINKIILNGIRNIDSVNLYLSKISALVGLNNYGKSNVLSSINFGLMFIRSNDKSRVQYMRNQSEIPINIMTSNKDFKFLFEFLYSINGVEYFVEYSYGFIWAKTDKHGSIIKDSNKINSEKLRMKMNVSGQQYATYITRVTDTCKYKKHLDTKNGRCDLKLDLDNFQLAIDKMSLIDGVEYKEIFDAITNIKFSLNNYIDTRNIDETFPFYIKGQEDFNLDCSYGRNISEIVFKLKKNYPNKFELLMDTYKQLFPNIEEIIPIENDFKDKEHLKNSFDKDAPFLISEKIYRLIVKDKNNNQFTSFNSLSNGSKRIFLFLVSAILSEINNISIIAFEELENCIHPALFQKLIIILDSLITNCRILVTSHSPFLIDYFELKRLYIGLPNEYGVADFRRIKNKFIKSLQNNAADEDITVGNYIFDALLNEDSDDLEAYCE